MELVFSTNELPEPNRFPYYREEFLRVLGCEFAIEEPEQPFSAEVRARTLADAALCRTELDGYSGSRGSREIARSARHPIFLVANISGPVLYRHDQDSTATGPNDLVLVDATRPLAYEMHKHDRHRAITLALDREALLPRLASPDLPALQLLTGGRSRPLGELLNGYLHSLANLDPNLPKATGRTLIEHFCGLLALALGANEETRETTGRAGLRTARLRAIRGYMEQHLGDPHLTPASVAAHFGISPRYLHKLFEETGTSFSQWLQARRLERCRRELTDPAHDAHGIAEIAYRWGFSDLSHFGRRFRALYGLSPRDMRYGQKCGR
jgi:AraC family transcriptional activator of tynA and feaB